MFSSGDGMKLVVPPSLTVVLLIRVGAIDELEVRPCEMSLGVPFSQWESVGLTVLVGG